VAARNRSGTSIPIPSEVRALDRIGRLLAMLATKGLSQKDQILLLKGAGFEVQEIADIVSTTPHGVSVALHIKQQRRRGSGRRAQRKK
jgi:hypothetical protein